MEGSCARAAQLGLESIAFTEHVDVTRWTIPSAVRERLRRDRDLLDAEGRFCPPELDVEGYMTAVARCRERFPQLRVLSGVELGEPHRFTARIRGLLGSGSFDRVLGALHTVEVAGEMWLVDDLMAADRPSGLEPAEVLRAYLAEAVTMVREFPDEVQVLAHIDYPVRGWAGDFEVTDFEEEFREVLSELSSTERALEVNTRVPLAPTIVSWWRDVGGRAVSFGSDAHRPDGVAAGFAAAASMVESHGFRRDRHPHGFWHR